MYINFKIKKINISFTFRHKWDEPQKIYNHNFPDYKIGLFFKCSQMVGKEAFNHKPSEWSKHMVNDYMFGINLLVIMFWLTINRGG